MKRRKVLWMTMAAAIGLALSAGATTLKRMNMDELTSAAQVVARVKCNATEVRWDHGEIFTFATFEVTETLKGSAPRQIVVRLLGGQLGHLKSTVDGVPRFAPGEEAYLFLEPTAAGDLSVTGWVQGTFRVRRDPDTAKEIVTQDTGAVSVYDPATRQFKPGGVRKMPLELFRQRVLDAIDRQGVGK
jgi:hypothetical protein